MTINSETNKKKKMNKMFVRKKFVDKKKCKECPTFWDPTYTAYVHIHI